MQWTPQSMCERKCPGGSPRSFCGLSPPASQDKVSRNSGGAAVRTLEEIVRRICFNDTKAVLKNNHLCINYGFGLGSWPWSHKISVFCVSRLSSLLLHTQVCKVIHQTALKVRLTKNPILLCLCRPDHNMFSSPSVTRVEHCQYVNTQWKSEIAVEGSASLSVLSNSLSCQNSSAMPSFSLN